MAKLSEIIRPSIQAILANAEIKAKGTCTPPLLDINAIKERADKYLGPTDETKTDIYSLIVEVERLRKLQNGHIS